MSVMVGAFDKVVLSQGRNGSGPGTHDFARQGTLAGDLSLPSDADTPHSRTTSTPNSIGRLQRIGAAQLWQVRRSQQGKE